jgi:hypothetical protein
MLERPHIEALPTSLLDKMVTRKIMDLVDLPRRERLKTIPDWQGMLRAIVDESGDKFPQGQQLRILNQAFPRDLRIDIAARQYEQQLKVYRKIIGRDAFGEIMQLDMFLNRFDEVHEAKIRSLRAKLVTLQVDTFDQFLEAMKFDHLMVFHTVGSDYCIGKSDVKGSRRTDDTMEEDSKRDTRRFRRRGRAFVAAATLAPSGRGRGGGRGGGRGRGGGGGGRGGDRPPPVCFWCNLPGHYSKDCRKKQRGDDPHPDSFEAKQRRDKAAGARRGGGQERPSVQLAVQVERGGRIGCVSGHRVQEKDDEEPDDAKAAYDDVFIGRVGMIHGYPVAPTATNAMIAGEAHRRLDISEEMMRHHRSPVGTKDNGVELSSHVLYWQAISGTKSRSPWMRAAIDNGAQVTMVTHEAVERFAGELNVYKQHWVLVGLGDHAVHTDRVAYLPMIFGDTIVTVPAVVIDRENMPLEDTELLVGLDVIMQFCSYSQNHAGPDLGVKVLPDLHSKWYQLVLRGTAVRSFYRKADTSKPPWKYEHLMKQLDPSLIKFHLSVVVPKELGKKPERAAAAPARASGGDVDSDNEDNDNRYSMPAYFSDTDDTADDLEYSYPDTDGEEANYSVETDLDKDGFAAGEMADAIAASLEKGAMDEADQTRYEERLAAAIAASIVSQRKDGYDPKQLAMALEASLADASLKSSSAPTRGGAGGPGGGKKKQPVPVSTTGRTTIRKKKQSLTADEYVERGRRDILGLLGHPAAGRPPSAETLPSAKKRRSAMTEKATSREHGGVRVTHRGGGGPAPVHVRERDVRVPDDGPVADRVAPSETDGIDQYESKGVEDDAFDHNVEVEQDGEDTMIDKLSMEPLVTNASGAKEKKKRKRRKKKRKELMPDELAEPVIQLGISELESENQASQLVAAVRDVVSAKEDAMAEHIDTDDILCVNDDIPVTDLYESVFETMVANQLAGRAGHVRPEMADLKSRSNSAAAAKLRAVRAEHEAVDVVADPDLERHLMQILIKGNAFIKEGEEAPHIVAPEFVRDVMRLKPDAKPWTCGPPRMVRGIVAENINKKMAALVKHKRIRRATPAESQWVCHQLLAVSNGTEVDGTPKHRLVSDLRNLNSQTESLQGLRFPSVQERLEKVSGHQWLSTFDAQDGFFQLRLIDGAEPALEAEPGAPMPNHESRAQAWMTHFRGITEEYAGDWVYCCCPQGAKNVPAVFNRVIEDAINKGHVIVRGQRRPLKDYCSSYADDIAVFADSEEEFIAAHIGLVRALAAKGIKLNKKKCHLALRRGRYLGVVVSKDGISVDPDKIIAIAACPDPINVKELQLFLGLAGYNKQFIPNFSTTAAPLFKLLRKDTQFVWGKEQKAAKEQLQAALVSAPVLAPYDPDKRIFVACDASAVAMGSVCKQEDDMGRLRPIGYASKTFNQAQTRMHALEREALCCVWSLCEKWRSFVMNSPEPTVLITDANGLRYLFAQPKVGSPARMRLERWVLALQSVEYVIIHRPGKAHVEPDALSRLVMPGTDIDYNVRVSPEVIDKKIMGIVNRDKEIRQAPVVVDGKKAPPTRSAAGAAGPRVDVPSILDIKNQQWKSIELEPILQRLRRAKKGELDPKEAKKVAMVPYHPEMQYRLVELFDEVDADGRRQRVKNVLVVDDVYRKKEEMKPSERARRAGPRIVVPPGMRQAMLEIHHDTPVAGHQGAHRTETSIIANFWWPGVHNDVEAYVEACVPCQRQRKPRKAEHAARLMTLFASKPREALAIDFTGPYPENNEGDSYVCTMICMSSGFMAAMPCKSPSAAEAARAITEKWLSMFGAPVTLLSDRGSALLSETLNLLADFWWMRRLRTSAYTPSSNAVLERRHSVLHNAMRKFIRGNPRNWGQVLPALVLAINTSVNRSIGKSPYEVMFGERARVVYGKVEIPDEMVSDPKQYGRLIAAKLREAWADVRWAHQDASEKRNAHWHAVHGVDYHITAIGVGDIVWRRAATPYKLESRMSGPYRTIRDLSDGAQRAFLVKEIATGRHSVVNRQDLRLHVGARSFTGPYYEELKANHVMRCVHCAAKDGERPLYHCATCTNSVCRVCLGSEVPRDDEFVCEECRAVDAADDPVKYAKDQGLELSDAIPKIDLDTDAKLPDDYSFAGVMVEVLWDHNGDDGRLIHREWHVGTVEGRARGQHRRNGAYGHYRVRFSDSPEPIPQALLRSTQGVLWRLHVPKAPGRQGRGSVRSGDRLAGRVDGPVGRGRGGAGGPPVSSADAPLPPSPRRSPRQSGRGPRVQHGRARREAAAEVPPQTSPPASRRSRRDRRPNQRLVEVMAVRRQESDEFVQGTGPGGRRRRRRRRAGRGRRRW